MTTTISCVDVGQGDCTVAVDSETGDGLLIDCRGGKHLAAVEELEWLGLKELRAAIVSHTQLDHFGGVLDVLEELNDRFTGALFFNQDSLMATPVTGSERMVVGRRLRALIHRAREFGDRVKRAEDSSAPGAAGSIKWQVLAPTYGEVLAAVASGDPNLASGVVLVRVGASCVLIGGDAPLATWERLADRVPKGCVVRWPHHGGVIGTGLDAHARLRDLLEPSVVLISVGATNGNGHPTASFFAAVGGRPGRLLCTQATRSCVAGGGLGGVCAGTIRVRVHELGESTVTPSAHDHARVIETFGNGQCLRQHC